MNIFTSMLYRELTCGAAAALITLVLSLAFLQTTSLPPGARAWPAVFVQMHPEHAWFGQPEPAVLVD
ncbi:MAG TPA: hypothetical protein VE819_00245 [Steroidobacteraceae bacterium]|jgi:hypothetical protein|nr:hypothetical protein [Steroidobacteraceae bacterium]